jgi:hypothetical protein
MVNHLETFYQNLRLKGAFGAFLMWLNGPAKEVVTSIITFNFVREYMLQGTFEYAKDKDA